jgi:hypothetical protein
LFGEHIMFILKQHLKTILLARERESYLEKTTAGG